VLSAGLIVVGLFLPMAEVPFGPPSSHPENPIRLENALIGYREGWLLAALAAAMLVALSVSRRLGRLSAVAVPVLVALAVATGWSADRLARSDLLDACENPIGDRGDLCDASIPEDRRYRAGYGFQLVALGAVGSAVAGLLLLVPSRAPRERPRSVADRDVVWL
jgi:hypothetical protein